MEMSRSKTVARLYKAVDIGIAGVKMTVLRLQKELEFDAVEVIDVVSDLHERYSKTPGYVVEVVKYNSRGEEVESSGFATLDGLVLFPRPARLVSVRVIDSGVEDTRPVDQLRKATPREKFYVSIGRIGLPKDVWGVVIETDRGIRVITRTALRG